MPGEIRTIINEPDFEITIYEWNNRTIQFLKIIADDKYNNNNKKNKPPDPKAKPDTQFIPDPKETKDDIPTEKEKQNFSMTPGKRIQIHQYKVKDEEILGSDGNMKIYKQVEEYLESHLPDIFTRQDMVDLVIKAWNEVFNQELSKGSATTYWIKYKRYMEKHGLIKEDESYHYHKVKEDETEPEGKDDDDDSGNSN